MKPPPFQRSSMIRGLLAQLPIELAYELLQSQLFHIGHVDVADAAPES